MATWTSRTKRWAQMGALLLAIVPSSGCFGPWLYLAKDAAIGGWFFGTTMPIPVTPFFSQKIEDTYWEEERYKRVPILDPIEGENAPLFCLDPPQPDEIIRALPDDVSGGVPFLAETFRNNVRFVVEKIVDRVDEPRFYPQVGPARLHHCHYKCTIYFEKTIRSSWPVPFTHVDQVEEVVYIDKDYLIRVGGPGPSDL